MMLVTLVWLQGAVALCQPKLILSKPSSYVPGMQVDPEVCVLDSHGKRVRLLDLAKEDTQLFVVVLFGGAFLKAPEGAFRGVLWCEDSFDDLAVQRALVRACSGSPVVFVPVAIPPVFSTVRYGYKENVFLGFAEDSVAYQKAVKQFIKKTELARESGLLPFEQIFYDPKSRLLVAPEKEVANLSGEAPPWQGLFKWREDSRKYGAPTIWLLGRDGQILAEPFWGNDYNSSPPQVQYGFRDLEQAVSSALASVGKETPTE